MTTLRPSLPPASSSSSSASAVVSRPEITAVPAQSPARRSNPFARPAVSHSPSSFSRSSLLPTLPSPSRPFDPLATPSDKLTGANGHAASTSSAGRARTGWRILWRGGLEIGQDGWRFDGVTFVAQLSFRPATPSAPIANPFDAPIQSHTPVAASPFDALPPADTDLCLSFESMKGRKYFQVKGLVELPEHEALDGGDDAGVQMSIAPDAPLLAAYFTGLLCRSDKLSAHGRTLQAVAIGLGDDIDSAGSTVLVYGQLSVEAPTPTLRLCVGRRKPPAPPPSEKKVRPGEPLPRPPLFFPSKAPKRPPPPFPRAPMGRALSRAPSTSSIYAPPPPPVSAPVTQAPAPVSGRTPGRRGEKRARPDRDDKDDERRRKAGKIVRPQGAGQAERTKGREASDGKDEDIFGAKGSTIVSIDTDKAVAGQDAKVRRTKIPQQVSDNKATIRKQTLVMLEERGFPRSHDLFKDVFGMTAKGCYFAFRDRLEDSPLAKSDIQRIVKGHLDMYLPPVDMASGKLSQVKEEEEDDVLFEPQLVAVEGESEVQSEVFTSEGAYSEGGLTSEAPISEPFSDAPLSEEPFSDGPLSEEALSGGPFSEGPLPEGVSPAEA